MGIIAYILVGLVAGAIAKLIMPGKDPGGFIITILLGIGGAMVGSYLANLLGWGVGLTGFDIPTILTAVGGAVLLLFIYRLIKKK